MYVKGLALFCFLKIKIGGDNINGNFFTLPNKIFDEGLTPNEFVVYSFLTKAKDKKKQSYWSVPNIAHYCGICENSCRKAIKSLTDKGYVDVTKRYIDNAQQSNIYTVCKIQTTPTSKFVDEQYKIQIEKQDSDSNSLSCLIKR